MCEKEEEEVEDVGYMLKQLAECTAKFNKYVGECHDLDGPKYTKIKMFELKISWINKCIEHLLNENGDGGNGERQLQQAKKKTHLQLYHYYYPKSGKNTQTAEHNTSMKFPILNCYNFEYTVYKVYDVPNIKLLNVDTLVILPNKRLLFISGGKYIKHICKPLVSYETGNNKQMYEVRPTSYITYGDLYWEEGKREIKKETQHLPQHQNYSIVYTTNTFALIEFTKNTTLSTDNIKYYDIVAETNYIMEPDKKFELSDTRLTAGYICFRITLSFGDVDYDYLMGLLG